MKYKNNKYNTELCDDKMTFDDCQLAILRHAVDETEKIKQQKVAQNEDVKRMTTLVETFIQNRKCICYGGTAINNILPKKDQFYNRDVDIPDYDFFSSNALSDAKDLADEYYNAGFKYVEAKSGVHVGTYKVFVNFIPMADITEMHNDLFSELWKDSIVIDKIHYAPPNFLRMSMFGELSKPKGDVSRWEKVLKRLTLLNKHYPIQSPADCQKVDFQRNMNTLSLNDSEKIYYTVRDEFIDQELVFFGGYASSLYSRFMPSDLKHIVKSIPDFDVLSDNPMRTGEAIKERLKSVGITNVKLIARKEIGEIIPESLEIRVNAETIAFVYKPISCHNYNKIVIHGKTIRVATIDTMLSFYLAFYYSNEPYYFKDRILCMAKFLFDVEQKNLLAQKGVLKRFSIECYGEQETLESMRAKKTVMFKKLKKGTKEYDRWFLKYIPSELRSQPQTSVSTTRSSSSPQSISKRSSTKSRSHSHATTKTKSRSHSHETTKKSRHVTKSANTKSIRKRSFLI